MIIGGGGGTGELPNALKVYNLNNPGDIDGNHLRKELDTYVTDISEVPNYIDVANVSIFYSIRNSPYFEYLNLKFNF